MFFRLILWIILSCAILNLLGFMLDTFWLAQRFHSEGYFQLEIGRVNGFPYWILATLLLVAMNGIAIFRLSAINVWARDYTLRFTFPPTRVFGINMVAWVFLVLLYVVLRIFQNYHGF